MPFRVCRDSFVSRVRDLPAPSVIAGVERFDPRSRNSGGIGRGDCSTRTRERSEQRLLDATRLAEVYLVEVA